MTTLKAWSIKQMYTKYMDELKEASGFERGLIEGLMMMDIRKLATEIKQERNLTPLEQCILIDLSITV